MSAPAREWQWYLFKDTAGKFRWNCKADNGNIVYASSQGYVNRTDCVANATAIGFSVTNMVDLTKT
ncbi:MAG: DUF1508 domain-containing protein ['Candidatus Kapabacteria' thiocyanatum]|nr:DUF1508 domain-containing protein ['Candidatus Kapabacteria' thiocyanatum]